jgi:hypothetical protein
VGLCCHCRVAGDSPSVGCCQLSFLPCSVVRITAHPQVCERQFSQSGLVCSNIFHVRIILIGGCAGLWSLQRLPMLSLCCRPSRPSCPGCLCLCLLGRCCTRPGRGGIFAFSPSSVLSVLCSLRLSALSVLSVLFCALSRPSLSPTRSTAGTI